MTQHPLDQVAETLLDLRRRERASTLDEAQRRRETQASERTARSIVARLGATMRRLVPGGGASDTARPAAAGPVRPAVRR